MAQNAIFSSRFVTNNHLIRHILCALNVHRFNYWNIFKLNVERNDVSV